MDKNKWTRKVPVVSTAHLHKDTLAHLQAAEPGVVADYGLGAFVYVNPDELATYPPEMQEIIAWFRTNYPGEYWIAFDRDGDVVPGIAHYDW